MDMEGKDIQSSQSANPSASDLCRGGCGFFGNPQWDGYCSKCKDKQVERLQQIQSPNGGRLSPTVLQTMVGRPPSANPSLTWTSQQANQIQPDAAAEQPVITAIIPTIRPENNALSASFLSPAVTSIPPDVEMSGEEQPPANSNKAAESLNETPALVPLSAANASGSTASRQASATSVFSVQSVSRVRSVSEMVTPSGRPAASGKASNRCEICNKKLTLAESMAGKCACERVFCSKHKAEREHDCKFDYKSHGKEKLARDNPAVVREKIEKL